MMRTFESRAQTAPAKFSRTPATSGPAWRATPGGPCRPQPACLTLGPASVAAVAMHPPVALRWPQKPRNLSASSAAGLGAAGAAPVPAAPASCSTDRVPVARYSSIWERAGQVGGEFCVGGMQPCRQAGEVRGAQHGREPWGCKALPPAPLHPALRLVHQPTLACEPLPTPCVLASCLLDCGQGRVGQRRVRRGQSLNCRCLWMSLPFLTPPRLPKHPHTQNYPIAPN